MDYLVTFNDGSEAYLAHYGVAGMKWGVRKNREAAFGKSVNKLSRYDTRAQRFADKRSAIIAKKKSRLTPEKKEKLLVKASKMEMKQHKHEDRAAMFLGNRDYKRKEVSKARKYETKARKLREKSEGLSRRTERLSYKQKKQTYKANKWANRMNQEFGSGKVGSASSEQRQLGKKYSLRMV